MIIEFEPNTTLLTNPPQWWLYYKNEDDTYFNKILVTYPQLVLFLETYGYETNDILELKKFGVNIQNIKQNPGLQCFKR